MGYRGKLTERDEARRLRALGMTMAEIATRLGVSKSSVSLWTRDVPFTPRPRGPRARNGHNNRLHLQKLAEIEALNAEGMARMGGLSNRDLLVAGTALYAAEGAKTDGAVAFANTDPDMVRLFCLWLRRFFAIDERRLRVKLYLHQGLDLAAAIEFWSELTGVPPGQFGKPYRAVPDGGIRHSKHALGCATVAYSCVHTHRQIMGLCRALLSSAPIPG